MDANLMGTTSFWYSFDECCFFEILKDVIAGYCWTCFPSSVSAILYGHLSISAERTSNGHFDSTF